jgi:hydrogenase expression/formation protein HypE
MGRSIDSMLSCPAPLEHRDIVELAHGGGGRKTARLIETLFAPAFRNPHLEPLGDGAIVTVGGERLAFTTDTFVVKPPFFPGGDIGSLAVHGTVNDLAMCGADPLFLSAGYLLEEGFPMRDLERVVAGDAVIVSGPIGDHGIAVMAAREGIDFETTLVSDSAPVVRPVRALLDAVPDTHVLRDPTRGGLATALCEIALASNAGIRLDEAAIPVRPEVQGACELLGFDPLYVACEGRFLAIVPGETADAALAAIRSQPGGEGACRVGTVVADDPGRLVLRTRIGSHRLLERLSGEQLPRIC